MKEQNFKQSVEEKSADKEFNHHQITKMIINNSLFFFFYICATFPLPPL